MRAKRLLTLFLSLSIICSGISCQAASVNISYSTINFPYDLAYINARRPTITGSLLDDHQKPVSNETIEVFINGPSVGTTVSNNDGIYALQLEQDMPDGQYVLMVFCIESQALLGPTTFTIDTTLPDITITYPRENEVIPSTTFTASGTTEENAMVETFLDDDSYGLVCYADESGNWSIEYSAATGSHTIKAQATDLAGNQGVLSNLRPFTITL